MGWIAYTLLMFVSSVALYLCVRKASLLKTSSALTNLAMFALPLVVYTCISAGQKTSFAMTIWQLIIIVAAAVVFAFGGNTASLKAIAVAPNPGYSLVLSKSYVLFTTVVAVTLMGADLTLQKAIAIAVIVAFSALVMINAKDTKQGKGSRWVPLSFAAFFAWGMLSLSSKYLFSHGVATFAFLVIVYAIVTLCIIWANKVRPKSLMGLSKAQLLLLLGIGVFSASFNLGQFEAIRLAPNVGYVNAANAGSIALVTVLAVALFKDELTVKKAIGILGVTAGLVLLFV